MKTYEWMLNVLSELETQLTNLTDDQNNKVFQHVLVGWRKPRQKSPCVYILPDRNFLEVPSVAADYHRLRYIILVQAELVTKKGSLQSAIRLAGRVHDLLVSDRTLNGKVDNLEVLSWDYDWPPARGYGRHAIALVVEFRKYLIPT